MCVASGHGKASGAFACFRNDIRSVFDTHIPESGESSQEIRCMFRNSTARIAFAKLRFQLRFQDVSSRMLTLIVF
jgi:hypothetical protein